MISIESARTSGRHHRILGLTGVVGGLFLSSAASAAVIAPTYSFTFGDAVTGDNAFTATNDGKRYHDVDPGADVYQNDVYERPTVQTYQLRSDGSPPDRYAASYYYGNLDIVQAKYGYDNTYTYVSIDMFSTDERSDGTSNDEKGLIYQYGFRIGNAATDPYSKGGLLLTVDAPSLKSSPTVFNGDKARGFDDTGAGDVGGVGISVTKEDVLSQVGGNGYDTQIISDGKSANGSGPVVLFSRINPSDPSIVEFAFEHGQYGFNPATLTYLVFEANKGLKDPANYLWNDEYTKSEAGSPNPGAGGLSEFGTQGLGGIYELDTVSGAVPEPGTAMAGLTLLGGLAMARGRRSR